MAYPSGRRSEHYTSEINTSESESRYRYQNRAETFHNRPQNFYPTTNAGYEYHRVPQPHIIPEHVSPATPPYYSSQTTHPPRPLYGSHNDYWSTSQETEANYTYYNQGNSESPYNQPPYSAQRPRDAYPNDDQYAYSAHKEYPPSDAPTVPAAPRPMTVQHHPFGEGSHNYSGEAQDPCDVERRSPIQAVPPPGPSGANSASSQGHAVPATQPPSSNNNSSPFRCKRCGAEFSTEEHYQEHRKNVRCRKRDFWRSRG